MSPSLPTIIVLKSFHPARRDRRKQIPFCVRHCIERDLYKNIHLCNIDDIESPHAKFQLVKVKADKGLYRIKCCYNKKLWSCNDYGFIQATEKEAVDSTLFKIEPVDTNKNTYRLMCVELQSYVRFDYSKLYCEADWVLRVKELSSRNDSHDVFTVINWESLVILPKNVAFKTNNDHYVLPKPFPNDGKNHLYASTTDIGDRRVEHQIIPLSDQKIGVKNNFTHGFWTYDGSYRKGQTLWQYNYDFLVAGSNDTSKPDSQFLPIKIGKESNLIALRNVDTDTLCYRDRGEFVLSDNKDRTIFEEAKVQVEELVLSRKVYDVDFRFDDTFIDSQSIDVKKVSDYSTNSLDTNLKKDLTLDYDEAIRSSYDTSVSVKTISGFSMDVTMPILEDKLYVTPSAEFTEETENKYSWGKDSETSFKIGVVLNVNVPPKTKVMAKMDVTKAECNIPFSYTQRDLTTRGEHVVQLKDDGVYTCKNCYIFDIKITEEAVKS